MSFHPLQLWIFLASAPESTEIIPNFRFNDFLSLAPEVNKISPRSLDLMTFWAWLQNKQKQCQKSRLNDFLALVPEVNKINPRSLDLMTFWPWLQKSTKSFPELSIWWLSGLGSRSPLAIWWTILLLIILWAISSIKLLIKMLTMLFSYVVNYTVNEIASNVSYLATCINR